MSEYPSGMTLRPIESWPGTLTSARERSNFSATWAQTLTLLDRELVQLSKIPHWRRPAPTVLQIAMREQDFRNDGMPRAQSKPAHPGVVLAIESKHGPLSYPCDKFDRWQDNLRAIALALEALRKVDRYGITQTGQQYTGWKQLGAGGSAIEAPVFASADAARLFLENRWLHNGDRLRDTFRRAQAATHPDRGGDRAEWDKVEAAGELLRTAEMLP